MDIIEIKYRVAQAVADAVKKGFEAELATDEIYAALEYPPEGVKADVALPCFKFARTLRKAPPQIASVIAENINKDKLISSIDSLNGFLNITLNDSIFSEELLSDIISRGEKWGRLDIGKGKTVVLDYSSPNVAKPFHIGHLGTTVIGHSLKKIHEFAGYKCVGVNHLGDWGTQFGKLIVAYRRWGDENRVKTGGIDELVDLYVRFHAEAEKTPSLEDEARAEFAKLEAGDADDRALWQNFVDISIKEYKKTYRQLGIEFDSYAGESFYYDKLQPVIDSLHDLGITKEDKGATIIDLTEYKMPPCLVLKSDGSTLYALRDICAAIYRKNTYNFDKCVYVTSAGQSLHFAQWFRVVDMMGYDWADRLVHVPYGTVSINGAKLATRTGNVILLRDLFADAIEKVKGIIDEKNPDLENKDEVAESVGVGAIVFHYLSNSRIKDINFVMEDALSFEGNTGPYAQYTYARCCSIIERGGGQIPQIKTVPEKITSEERELLCELSRFGEAVSSALDAMEPMMITRYILDVCAAFNRFYHECQILSAEDEITRAFRISLTAAVKYVLGEALELICMKKTEKI